jgi:hypothetical protein
MNDHLITIRRSPDWPHDDLPPGTPWSPNDDDDYGWEITCLDPGTCIGWESCRLDYQHDTRVRDGIPSVAPHWAHGPDDIESDGTVWEGAEEADFHGVTHTWHWDWGWTVPYVGCIVAAQDGVCDEAHDIACELGPGSYICDTDWYDETSVRLYPYASPWPRQDVA